MVAVARASTGLTTHRPASARVRAWCHRSRDPSAGRDREPVCESHDSTGEPGAGDRPAGFGERGEETCSRESDCGPVAKAPDDPPIPTGYAPPLDSTGTVVVRNGLSPSETAGSRNRIRGGTAVALIAARGPDSNPGVRRGQHPPSAALLVSPAIVAPSRHTTSRPGARARSSSTSAGRSAPRRAGRRCPRPRAGSASRPRRRRCPGPTRTTADTSSVMPSITDPRPEANLLESVPA